MESSRERKELAEYLAALPLFGRGIVFFFLNVRFAHSIPRLSTCTFPPADDDFENEDAHVGTSLIN
jgi:hypothetical protein